VHMGVGASVGVGIGSLQSRALAACWHHCVPPNLLSSVPLASVPSSPSPACPPACLPACSHQDNGLKLSNSWEGYFVLLNPDYRAQVGWRCMLRVAEG